MRGSFAVFKPLRGQAPSIARPRSQQNITGRKLSSEEILVTPPPQQILLLEGDEYSISNQGIARTFFSLSHRRKHESSHRPKTSLSVEELYDLHTARKKFILRGINERQQNKTDGKVHIGYPLLQISDFQEIINGISNGAGTGALTWESTFAMVSFFSEYPEKLKGSIIELGSGTGCGGILLDSLTSSSCLHRASDVESITLTDVNSQVLEQCRKNVSKSSSTLKVSKLDWHDFIRQSKEPVEHLHKYDTVIACDCAYLYPDIEALSATLQKVLRTDNPDSKIHIFGPYNRGGLQELLKLLKSDENGLKVETELIDLDKFRLEPQKSDLLHSNFESTDCAFSRKSASKFLHITCSIQRDDAERSKPPEPIDQID